MEKPIRIYQCENTQEGILSAIYEAGISGYGHRFIRIAPQRRGDAESLELFSEYIDVDTDSEKAECVLRTVREKISLEAYQFVLRVLAAQSPTRADVIYQFVTYGFTMGAKVTKALQIPCVQQMFALERKIGNEVHHFREFLRFQQVSEDPSVLLAVIEPEGEILNMLTPHFADRLRPERFVIYDKTHNEAAFHVPEEGWFVRVLTNSEQEQLENMWEQKEEYVDLWKVFFENICIRERKNENLQRNMAPLKYREHMTEFSASKKD